MVHDSPTTSGIQTGTLQLAARYSTYELLRVYTYYRTVLGSILLLMFQGQVAPNILGNDHPELFLYTSITYTGLNLITLGLLWRAKFSPSVRQIVVLLLIDLLAVGLLMHASGGAISGLGYLLLVVVAAAGMLLPDRSALFLTALATLLVFAESLSRTWPANGQSVFTAGSLGALLFITAIAFQYLTKKIRASHLEAQNQAEQAAHLQKLAQLIVERMQTGVLVINHQEEVELLNKSAMDLLGVPADQSAKLSLKTLPELREQLSRWQQNQALSTRIRAHNANDVKINFAQLGESSAADTLVFVEDNRLIAQQAQQLKLASLGRLTASIAHEVRNPLGAISHASQLLAESAELKPDDARLVAMINDHGKRVNEIIENVLQLSRRRPAAPQQVQLAHWLPKFIKDYCSEGNHRIPPKLELRSKNVMAKFDPGQLRQVLTNLCDNGQRYSEIATGKADVRLEAGIDTSNGQAYIRVIDLGDGIAVDDQKHIFEPFYTTSNRGSGLGLYICKELCEANQAFIDYRRTSDGLSCFHLQLAHPDRAL